MGRLGVCWDWDEMHPEDGSWGICESLASSPDFEALGCLRALNMVVGGKPKNCVVNGKIPIKHLS